MSSSGSSEEQDKKNNNFAGAFVSSFGHSLIQGPIDGVREIVNTISDKEVVPKFEVVKRPENEEHGTPAWTGQQLGKTVGVIGMLVLCGKLLRFRR